MQISNHEIFAAAERAWRKVTPGAARVTIDFAQSRVLPSLGRDGHVLLRDRQGADVALMRISVGRAYFPRPLAVLGFAGPKVLAEMGEHGEPGSALAQLKAARRARTTFLQEREELTDAEGDEAERMQDEIDRWQTIVGWPERPEWAREDAE